MASTLFNTPHHYDAPPYTNGTPHTNGAGPSRHPPYMDGPVEVEHNAPTPLTGDPSFDILEWYPAYQSCQRFFLDHAQHEQGTQALCSLINIRLPFQYLDNPITASTPGQSTPTAPSKPSYNFSFRAGGSSSNSLPSPQRSRGNSTQTAPVFISLIPYIRRLIITGFDKTPILHGIFGDDYARGVLPHLECERRNYLFAAKHGGWRSCKKQYDNGSGMGGGDESVPFMKPLDEAKMEELNAAEKAWSGWLAMEDWMVGPRAPDESVESSQFVGASSAVHMTSNENMPGGAGDDYEPR